jgi:molybdenum cofactor cytidylyltransferase
VPTRAGRRGNPVLWPRKFFDDLMSLEGDVGARDLLSKHADQVRGIEMDTEAIFEDIDTAQQFEQACARASLANRR